jgi:hypothetical protein
MKVKFSIGESLFPMSSTSNLESPNDYTRNKLITFLAPNMMGIATK